MIIPNIKIIVVLIISLPDLFRSANQSEFLSFPGLFYATPGSVSGSADVAAL